MTSDVLPRRAWPTRTEIAWIVAFWATLGTLTVLQEALEPWEDDPIRPGQIAEAAVEVGLWALATPLVFWVVARAPAERGAWAGRLLSQAAVVFAVAVAAEALQHGLVRPAFRGPPSPDRAWSLVGSIVRLRILDEVVIGLAILAAAYARAALADARARQGEAERLLTEQARLEGQLAAARLAALQMQLHPHFLFNALNAVSALVERDPPGVRTLVARLSSLLRRVLDADGAQLIPLHDEAAFLRDYLDVQRVRFQGRLEVEEAWAPGTARALVPPLILQLLVENAVSHGTAQIEEGVGRIRLAARIEPPGAAGRLVLTVDDDGPGFDGSPERHGGVGLANTRARLAALYGDRADLSVTVRPGGGVRAEVAVPYQTAAPASGGSDAADKPKVPSRD